MLRIVFISKYKLCRIDQITKFPKYKVTDSNPSKFWQLITQQNATSHNTLPIYKFPKPMQNTQRQVRLHVKFE